MFIPWKGSYFNSENNLLGGFRLLVLGESHYGGRVGSENPGLTQRVVKEHIADGRYPFFSRVLNIVLSRSGPVPNPFEQRFGALSASSITSRL